MTSLVRFIMQRLKLKVNEAKSAVAQPQQRKFLGFSFSDGPTVLRTIAPKALERFKQRIRDITRRARGASVETIMAELASVYAGLARLFRILRNAPSAAGSHALGSGAASVCLVATMENTTPSPGSTDRPRGLSMVGGRYRRQCARTLAPGPIQGPLTRVKQCLLSIARSSCIGQGALAIAARTAVYGPVCTVVWEGRSRKAPPYPDLRLEADQREVALDDASCSHNGCGA